MLKTDWKISILHTIDYGTNIGNFGIIRKIIPTLLSMVQSESNRLKMAHIKISHMLTIWVRALFPVEQISMSWVFRYLQAVVLFLNCVHWFLLAFAFCSWQYSGKAFFSRSFRWPLLFASLLRLFVSFRCSAAFYCFRDVQIIMSVNINQMINKNNSSILL